MMDNDIKGILLAIIAGASFGLIPLFCIPVVESGMGYTSIIFWRFFFGSLGMLGMMWYKHQSLSISWSDFWRISILSIIYLICAYTLFISYNYISSGISTAMIYTNPIWCAIIGLLFLGDRFSWRVTSAILTTFVGVALLAGVDPMALIGQTDGDFMSTVAGGKTPGLAWLGVFLGLCSGIGYGIYLVVLPRLRLKKMPSLKFTFYIFSLALIYLLPVSAIEGTGIEFAATPEAWLNLILLGLLPTAFSNICVTMALRMIDTTVVSVLGAFEPLTAMVIGILVLHEPFDAFTIIGGLMVLVGVMLITVRKSAA